MPPTTEAGRRSWTYGVATSGLPSDTSKRSRGSSSLPRASAQPRRARGRVRYRAHPASRRGSDPRHVRDRSSRRLLRDLVRYREFMPSAACGRRYHMRAATSRCGARGATSATSPSSRCWPPCQRRELGLVWAVVDDGWQTSEGDWYLDPKKFPRGTADMVALTSAIKAAGMWLRLWIARSQSIPARTCCTITPTCCC